MRFFRFPVFLVRAPGRGGPLNSFSTQLAVSDAGKKIRSLIRYDHDFRGIRRDCAKKISLGSNESGKTVASNASIAKIRRWSDTVGGPTGPTAFAVGKAPVGIGKTGTKTASAVAQPVRSFRIGLKKTTLLGRRFGRFRRVRAGVMELTTDDKDIVSALLAALAAKVGKERFELWFGPRTRIDWDGQVLTIGAANQFFLDWIRANFRTAVEDACVAVLGRRRRWSFVSRSPAKAAARPNAMAGCQPSKQSGRRSNRLQWFHSTARANTMRRERRKWAQRPTPAKWPSRSSHRPLPPSRRGSSLRWHPSSSAPATGWPCIPPKWSPATRGRSRRCSSTVPRASARRISWKGSGRPNARRAAAPQPSISPPSSSPASSSKPCGAAACRSFAASIAA